MMIFKPKEVLPDMDSKVVAQIRALGLDMIQNAKSGHPGIVLGAAPILYTLYSKHMKINPEDPDWINRDRFVMSAGHGSALLYATLHMAGYPITLDDLKDFRKLDSITPGHPEVGVTPGVDASSGPLGQGVGLAVGMAIGEEYLRNTLKAKKEPAVDYYTYVLVGDGDMMEGVSYEALSLAGTLQLSKLIVLYDNNGVTLDNTTSISFTEDVLKRMSAMGFEVLEVEDGEDLVEINGAIARAKESDKPSFISIKTTIGKFSKLEGTNLVHGKVLEEEDVLEIKNKLNVREVPFTISSEVMEYFQNEISSRSKKTYEDYQKKIESTEEKELLTRLLNKNYKINLKNINVVDNPDEKRALRDISGDIVNSVEDDLWIGGSCDLFSSCKTYQKEKGDFSPQNRCGKNIWFGVREHAAAAIVNGLALVGLRPYVSTFLSFSDYMKPAIRMSAIMNLPVTYIFTHDSISVGEDGPTHQPVEQLDSLAIIPNLEVFRPGDLNEIIGSYKTILAKKQGPSVLSISKSAVTVLPNSSIPEVSKGCYIVSPEEGKLQGILVASGEDLQIAIELQKRFLAKGIFLRVVSMVSTSRFSIEDDLYQDEIFPSSCKKIVITSSTGYQYYPFLKDKDQLISLRKFGFSASKDDLAKKLQLDVDYLEKQIRI